MKNTCAECLHFEPILSEVPGSEPYGECCRRACSPVIGVEAAGLRWARWPLVLASRRACGEYQPPAVKQNEGINPHRKEAV